MATTYLPKDTAYARLAKALLSRSAGFQHCALETLDYLVDEARFLRAGAGDQVSRRGEPYPQLTLIVEGVLEAGIELGTGKRHLASYLKAGEVTGILPCIDGKPIPHDTYAHTEVVLMHVPLAALRRRLAVDNALSVALALHLAARARFYYDRAAEIALLSPRARLCRLLSGLAKRYGVERGTGLAISIRVSQSDLADLLATSRQWTNKELKELEAEGILCIRRSSIEIQRMDKLELLAGGLGNDTLGIDP